VTQTEFSISQIEEIWNGEEPKEDPKEIRIYKVVDGWDFTREEQHALPIENLQVLITPEKEENRID
jgi:hypothetical protein